MKVAGIIPARYSSTRLPGKPLLLIKGKPMIQRIYEQSLKAKLIDRVIVATDDLRILKCVKDFGGEAVMTSPKHKSGTDRVKEAADKITCNIVVNIQGDEPYINPGDIDKAVMPLLDDLKVNVSTLATKIKNAEDIIDPNKVKVVMDKDNFALYFSRSPIPYDMQHNPLNEWTTDGNNYFKHIGLYVFRKTFLMKFSKLKQSSLERSERLEQLRILESGERIKVVICRNESVSVDTKEDYARVNL